jgi:hypothetical protein
VAELLLNTFTPAPDAIMIDAAVELARPLIVPLSLRTLSREDQRLFGLAEKAGRGRGRRLGYRICLDRGR